MLPRRIRDLPTRQVVIADGPHPPVELVTIAATLEPIGPRRPCPARARSIGIWRSLTDNNGWSQDDLTCGIGVASGMEGLPGRAFQARDRWAHIWAISGPRTTGPQRNNIGNRRPVVCPAQHQDAGTNRRWQRSPEAL
jgi:hypothetical protein